MPTSVEACVVLVALVVAASAALAVAWAAASAAVAASNPDRITKRKNTASESSLSRAVFLIYMTVRDGITINSSLMTRNKVSTDWGGMEAKPIRMPSCP